MLRSCVHFFGLKPIHLNIVCSSYSIWMLRTMIEELLIVLELFLMWILVMIFCLELLQSIIFVIKLKNECKCVKILFTNTKNTQCTQILCVQKKIKETTINYCTISNVKISYDYSHQYMVHYLLCVTTHSVYREYVIECHCYFHCLQF